MRHAGLLMLGAHCVPSPWAPLLKIRERRESAGVQGKRRSSGGVSVGFAPQPENMWGKDSRSWKRKERMCTAKTCICGIPSPEREELTQVSPPVHTAPRIQRPYRNQESQKQERLSIEGSCQTLLCTSTSGLGPTNSSAEENRSMWAGTYTHIHLLMTTTKNMPRIFMSTKGDKSFT